MICPDVELCPYSTESCWIKPEKCQIYQLKTMQPPAILYTLSKKNNMQKQLLHSINSILKYVDPEQIHVYSTPPHIDKQFEKKLTDKNINIHYNQNETPYFEMRPGKGGYYAEKIAKLSTLTTYDNVLLLDCDTTIHKHPAPLFYGDFDISARVGTGYLDFNFTLWNKSFTEQGKTPIPMMNTGVVAFKNKSHLPISHEALKQLKKPFPAYHHKKHWDQYALSLAASGYKIKWMTKNEHAFRWEYEPHNTVVYHGQRRKTLKSIAVKLKEVLNYVT
jgi:hypothetical protein